MRELEKTDNMHSQAVKIRLDFNTDRIRNSYSNISCMPPGTEKPKDARGMLKRCSSLKGFSDISFQIGNQCFSGIWCGSVGSVLVKIDWTTPFVLRLRHWRSNRSYSATDSNLAIRSTKSHQ